MTGKIQDSSIGEISKIRDLQRADTVVGAPNRVIGLPGFDYEDEDENEDEEDQTCERLMKPNAGFALNPTQSGVII